MEFMKSSRGSEKILLDGYVYVKVKDLVGGVVCYECEKRRYSRQCKARLKVKGNEVIGFVNEHTHEPDPTRKETLLEAAQSVDGRTRDVTKLPNQNDCTAVAKDGLAELHAVRHSGCNRKRTRQQRNCLRSVASTLENIALPMQCIKIYDNEDILLYDSGPKEERMLIFGTHENLHALELAQGWFMDGAFDVATALFAKVCTIHVLLENQTIPCVYAIFISDTLQSYIEFFEQLKTLRPNLSPVSIMLDFDETMFRAVRVAFPNSELKGSFFHLRQDIFQKVQKHSLHQLHKDNVEVTAQSRMLLAIAFLPVDDVVSAFEELTEELSFADCIPITDYFEDTFIGRPSIRGFRRQPVFPVAFWNMYTRAKDELLELCDSVETWHQMFQLKVSCPGGGILEFIEFLRYEQTFQHVYLTHFLLNENPRPPTQECRHSNVCILNVVATYKGLNKVSYVQEIARHLSL